MACDVTSVCAHYYYIRTPGGVKLNSAIDHQPSTKIRMKNYDSYSIKSPKQEDASNHLKMHVRMHV